MQESGMYVNIDSNVIYKRVGSISTLNSSFHTAIGNPLDGSDVF